MMEGHWRHPMSIREQHKSCSWPHRPGQLLPEPWVSGEDHQPWGAKMKRAPICCQRGCLSVAKPLGSPFLIQQGLILIVKKMLPRAVPKDDFHQYLCTCNQQHVSKQNKAWKLPKQKIAFPICVCRAGNPGPEQWHYYCKYPKQKLKGGELRMFFRRWRAMSPFVHLCQTQPERTAGGRWFEHRKTSQNGSKPQKYQFAISWTITSQSRTQTTFPWVLVQQCAAYLFISWHWGLRLHAGLCLLKCLSASHRHWAIILFFLTAMSCWSNCIKSCAAFCETQAIKSHLSYTSLTTCGIGYRKAKDPNHLPLQMGKQLGLTEFLRLACKHMIQRRGYAAW